jgi:hypothetical protein
MIDRMREVEIVNDYLCQIKKRLPLSIRVNRQDLDAILEEIEEHIWDKAIENAENRDPSEIDLQIVISQMGDAKEIAESYRTKSVPHIFISEELYPLCVNCLRFLLFSLFFTFIFPFQSYLTLHSYYLDSLSTFLFLLFRIPVIHLTLFLAVVIAFFYLSTSGYLPYEARISKFHKKFPQPLDLNGKTIKHPINLKISIIWAGLWLFGVLFFSVLSYVTKNPNNFTIALFTCLFIIKLLRIALRKRSVRWQRLLIIVELILLYVLIASYVFIKRAIVNGTIVVEGLLINFRLLHMWLLPLYLIVINYKIFQFFIIKNKYERYLTYLSLRKRIITKNIYINKPQNYQEEESASNLDEIDSRFNSFRNDDHIKQEIRKLIKKSYKELPFWFRKSEKRAILNEIECQVMEVILEREAGDQLSAESLVKIFQEVADFNNLTLEFKQKGTPKLYLSKELWPWYITSSKAIITYFIMLGVFTLVLQISFRNEITVVDVLLVYFDIYWFFWILAFYIITGIFIYLSINDFIPQIREPLKVESPNTEKKERFKILDRSFAIFYLIIGCLLLIYINLPGYFSTYQQELLTALLIIILIFAIGSIKILHIPFSRDHKRRKLIRNLIILSLSFIILFNLMFNFHLDHRIIHSTTFLNIFTLLFFPINIEILYQIFQFFFTKKFL